MECVCVCVRPNVCAESTHAERPYGRMRCMRTSGVNRVERTVRERPLCTAELLNGFLRKRRALRNLCERCTMRDVDDGTHARALRVVYTVRSPLRRITPTTRRSCVLVSPRELISEKRH